MFDSAPIRLQRIRGEAAVEFGASGLSRLYQSGSAKAMLPRSHGPVPEVVFLNTAGGLTGGDRLAFHIALDEGVRLTATTQTAERAYRTPGARAEVSVSLRVGAAGHLDWLPQETILFDGAALGRTTRIDLEPGATCLACETLVLGRGAMGETVRSLDLFDKRVILRRGDPVLVEPFALDGDDLASGDPAGIGAARAVGTIIYIGPDAEDRLAGTRRIASHPWVASAWDGKMIVRAIDCDPSRLRRSARPILEFLRGAALPRVWQN